MDYILYIQIYICMYIYIYCWVFNSCLCTLLSRSLYSVQQRAVEKLAASHAKSFDIPAPSSSTSLLSAVRPSRQMSDADIQLEISEASEQLDIAIKNTQDACEHLLVCMRKQDQVRMQHFDL
jgi:hypothetical protein